MKRRNFITALIASLPLTVVGQRNRLADTKEKSIEIISRDSAKCAKLDDEVFKYSVYTTEDGQKYTGAYARQLWLRRFSAKNGYFSMKVNQLDQQLAKTTDETVANNLRTLRNDYFEASLHAQFCIHDVTRLMQKYD